MTVETLNDALETEFRTQINLGGDGGAAVPVKYPNGPVLGILGAEVTQPDDEAWIEVHFTTGSADPVEIGPSSIDRTVGVLIATVRVPLETGQQAIDQYSDRIIAAFRKKDVGDATFRVPYVTSRRIEGRWWRLNVNCPFISDELT